MRIAFVANRYLDPDRRSSWSGLPFFIRRSLERAGLEVETWVLGEPRPAAGMVRHAYWRFLRGRRFLRGCDLRLLSRYAMELQERLARSRPDALFCPSSWPVARVKADVPCVFWTDATFAGMVNFYESFTDLAPPNLADGHSAEYAALGTCARAIYSSPWAAASAMDSYAADPSRIRVVPFGANIMEPPRLVDVAASVSGRDPMRCNLLLIGVDWDRKGAAIAAEAAASLNERGMEATLTVVGCQPPAGAALPGCVRIEPFIDKGTAEGSARFEALCRRSHFLIMPSRADCTPVAIAEGNHFGLPCLATDVGGIPSLVTNDVNGRLFDLRARGMCYADHILGLMRDPARYRALAVGSAAHAQREFSWDASGARVAAILAEAAAGRASARSRPQPVAAGG